MKKVFLVLVVFMLPLCAFAQMEDPVGTTNEDGQPLEAPVIDSAPPPVEGGYAPKLEPRTIYPVRETPKEKPSQTKEADAEAKDLPKGILVTYLDLEYAFKNHPWTVQTKSEFKNEIDQKANELAYVQSEIDILKESNKEFLKEIDSMRPFYQNIYVETEGTSLPRQDEGVKEGEFDNIISYIVFSGAESRAFSPVDSPEILATIKDTIKENADKIKEKELYLEKERSRSGGDIKAKEQEEVLYILEDIYSELKSYARKRNIQIVVNKKEVLYGLAPVDITLDFTTALKRDKKTKPKKKEKKK